MFIDHKKNISLGILAFKKGLPRVVRKGMKEFIDLRFDSETAPSGVAWKKRRDNLPHKILQLTGQMRRRGRVRAVRRGNSVHLSYVNKTPFASEHQFGRRRYARMPARPFLPKGTEQKGGIVKGTAAEGSVKKQDIPIQIRNGIDKLVARVLAKELGRKRKIK